MMDTFGNGLTRIGVFYDGNYFFHVSNYYNYGHQRKSRLSIAGLHEYIRRVVGEAEGYPDGFGHCQIVDAHYFRARLSAKEASEKGNQLYYDRVFDDILMSQGVTTHYLPVKSVQGRGLDVWLALEAFEMAFYKRFDVLVLIASDNDYVPLIRKLNTLGTRVMLLAWNFEFTDDFGNRYNNRVSQELFDIATYPVAMNSVVDEGIVPENFNVDNLFVPKPLNTEKTFARPRTDEEGVKVSAILSLKDGYGFIKYPNNNLYFHYSSVNGVDFNDLEVGDTVQFSIAQNERGENIAIEVELIE